MSEDCMEHSYIYTHEGNAHHTVYGYSADDCPYCEIDRLKHQLKSEREAFVFAQDEDLKRNEAFEQEVREYVKAEFNSELTELRQRLASKEDALAASMLVIEEYKAVLGRINDI